MTTLAAAAALLLSACGAAAFAPPVPAGIRHSFAPRLAAHEPHLAAYESLFSGLAASPGFRKAWTRAPMLYDSPIAGVAGSWTLADVSAACTAGELAQAGRGTHDPRRGGWKMARVGPLTTRTAATEYADVEASLAASTTVVFNSCDARVPRLAALSVAAMDALGCPAAMNMYLTGKGASTSAPPHTDKQDVIVMQTSGKKRWRVYAPPPPAKRPSADPLARGKADDQLALGELSAEPLVDAVLAPGHLLYVPAGFPHTTDTVNVGNADGASAEDSVHLTLGLDTHVWGLDLAAARKGAFDRAALSDRLHPQRGLDADAYWALHAPLPGFAEGAAALDAEALSAALVNVARVAEPERWAGSDDAALAETLRAAEVGAKLAGHAGEVRGHLRALYAAVADGKGSEKLRNTQFNALEKTQVDLLEWYGNGPARKALDWQKGDKVEAPLGSGDTNLFPGVVEKAYADGTVDVAFGDGDSQAGIDGGLVRMVRKANPGLGGGGSMGAKMAAAKPGFGGGGGKAKAKKKKKKK